jgi:hypothetical protein
MGLLFLSHQRGDLIAAVEKVTQRVEHLGLGQSQGRGDLGNRFPANVKGRSGPRQPSEAFGLWRLSITAGPLGCKACRAPVR